MIVNSSLIDELSTFHSIIPTINIFVKLVHLISRIFLLRELRPKINISDWYLTPYPYPYPVFSFPFFSRNMDSTGSIEVLNGNQASILEETGSKKREDYIEWNDYFMAVAFLSAMRSKDPVSQVIIILSSI